MPVSVSALRVLLLLAMSWHAQGAVVFNEIHYHPVEKGEFQADGTPVLDLSEDIHEFLEFHNTGTGPVSLDGWTLSGGVNFNFPTGTTIPAGAFLVVAGNPDRIAAVYSLPREQILGPWTGNLSNRGERISLRDSVGATQDEVEYRTESPWAIAADGLGADDEWTGLAGRAYQYRGRSLERVSFTHPSDDPANWLASPLSPGPSPGRPNAVTLETARPVVLSQDARSVDGSPLIRSNQAVRVECVFTTGSSVRNVQLEWYREDLNAAQKPTTLQPMWPVGSGQDARFQTDVAAQTNRTIVRYRIRADRGAGDEVVSPRADDPFRWHAWYVSPVRNPTTNEIYDLFISRKSLDILRTNIAGNPRRVMLPDPPGMPRPSWNATQPALFVHNGHVYDVQMRHHGSQFRRDVSRKSYKIQFPAYDRFQEHESLFLTDKDFRTYAGHTVFRAAGLPTPRTWWIDLYMNGDARLQRLAQEEYDLFLLERHHREEAAARGSTQVEPAGEFYKSQGVFEPATGPYGGGNGSLLPARVNKGTNAWTPLQRYEWTYTVQMHGWKGHTAFGTMISNMWQARSNATAVPSGQSIPKLRDYFNAQWDLDKALTHMALVNWQCVWDDTMHNYFLWQQANGKWAMLPWDFDDQFNARGSSISIFNGDPFAGPNFFKQSLVTAYREEFKRKAWWLNNTLLDPENLTPLGISTQIRSWAVQRQRSVNTQLGLGFFTRPVRPTNSLPADLTIAGPGALLESSGYGFNTNLVVAHAASVWQIRDTARSWFEPVLTETNVTSLTRFALPVFPFEFGRTYAWRVQHIDADGHPSPWSAETRFQWGAEPGAAVQLNEMLALNGGSVANGSSNPDYIELFNPTDAAVNLQGWSLTDDLQNPARFVFPADAVIPAGGHLVVWCDSRDTLPGLHSGFGLRREGETVGLFAPGASGFRLVDVLRFGWQLSDLAVGRTGTGSAWTAVIPSPGAPNTAVPLGNAASVRLNEWMTAARQGDDWLEVYNPEALRVDLGGLIFADGRDESTLPPLSFVDAGGFLQLRADGLPSNGADHLNFRLSSVGGEISIRLPNGRRIDRVLYPRQARDVPQGRVPDGSESVYALPTATPGASNVVDTDSDGLPDLWELAVHLNPLVKSDADDNDNDGWNNRQEFQLGTHPTDTASRFALQVDPAGRPGDPDALGFLATPGHRYVVEQVGPGGSGWIPFEVIPPAPSTRWVQIPLRLDAANPGGMFRVTVD